MYGIGFLGGKKVPIEAGWDLVFCLAHSTITTSNLAIVHLRSRQTSLNALLFVLDDAVPYPLVTSYHHDRIACQ